MALSWGLHLSSGRKNPSLTTPEPDVFVEPGFFIVKNDGSLWKNLPDNFKKDKEVLLLAIDDIGSDFEDVDENLRNDPDVKKAFDNMVI